jgi:Zn-finger protein
MTYKAWCDEHAKKHAEIIAKLDGKSVDAIIAYFDYDNMKQHEPDFCFLYTENKKCHDMEKLNCYLCACPHFRFDDSGIKKIGKKTLYSFCSIHHKKGSIFESEDALHQDCSNCLVPHKQDFVKKLFDKKWNNIMKDTSIAHDRS